MNEVTLSTIQTTGISTSWVVAKRVARERTTKLRQTNRHGDSYEPGSEVTPVQEVYHFPTLFAHPTQAQKKERMAAKRAIAAYARHLER